jgi:hypothetical protein
MLSPAPEGLGRFGARLLGALALASLGWTWPHGVAIQKQPAHGIPAACVAEDVNDSGFAFLIGTLDCEIFGEFDHGFVDSLTEAHGGTKLPFEHLRVIRRSPGSDGADATVEVRFQEALDLPIPYSILGYNPGSLRATPALTLLEWRLGDQVFQIPGEDGKDDRELSVQDARLFGVVEGSFEFDIDGWLDRLMGGKLDDIGITGFLTFRRAGHAIGLGFGYTPKGAGRTGVFDLTRDEAIFPADREYLALGRLMRARTEELSMAAGFPPSSARTPSD